ncbi:CTAG [Symbiodinium sp. CCMP2592]|nr:CTAG [Symbiodinium sp. CCMP2592]
MAFPHPGLHQCSSRCFLGGPTNEQLLPRGRRRQLEQSLQTTWWYGAAGMTIFALVFACVPLYKIYCQATGQGQASSVGHKEYSPPPSKDSVDAKRLVTVDFAATVHTSLPWQFVPQQRRVVVGVGGDCASLLSCQEHQRAANYRRVRLSHDSCRGGTLLQQAPWHNAKTVWILSRANGLVFGAG